MSSNKKVLAPWNGATPMKRGDMTTIIKQISRIMRVSGTTLLSAVIQVLKQKISTAKFNALQTQNVSNGTNDQKRLVLRTAAAYNRYVNKRGADPINESDSEDEELSSAPSSPLYPDSSRLSAVGNAAGLQPFFGPLVVDSSDDDEPLCMACNRRPIDTVNMPCNCETCCSSCAANLQENEPNRCLKCMSHVRSTRRISEPYRIQCAACGFTWDGNAQHICDATDRRILLPKQFTPPWVAEHPIITEKVTKAVKRLLKEYATPEIIDGVWARGSKWEGGQFYQFKLRDEWFGELQREMRHIGLELVGFSHELDFLWPQDCYEMRVDPQDLENIGGRYGPNKNRTIRIPKYASMLMENRWNFNQKKVFEAVKDVPVFNWVMEGLSRSYVTEIAHVSDKTFEKYRRNLRTVGLLLMVVRATYFNISYVIVPSPEQEDKYI